MLIFEYESELCCSDTGLINDTLRCIDKQQSPNKHVVSPPDDVPSEAIVLGMLMNVVFDF